MHIFYKNRNTNPGVREKPAAFPDMPEMFGKGKYMGKFETDKKLELIRAIRMQNQYDRQTMRQREGILYESPVSHGHGEIYGLEEAVLPAPAGKYSGRLPITGSEQVLKEEGGMLKGFRLRLAIAMILFLAFVYCDVKQVSPAGKSTEQIFHILQEDQLGSVTDYLLSLKEMQVP